MVNTAGATYQELARFCATVRDGSEPEVSLLDGTTAVLIGIAAQRSIELGEAVLWSDILSEFKSAYGLASQVHR